MASVDAEMRWNDLVHTL